jgi:predicted nuclease of predicted toxin-antitoxin system
MRLLGAGMFMFQSLRVLRDARHDTATVARQHPSPQDPEVMRRAAREGRILLTFDKDFRRHIYEE